MILSTMTLQEIESEISLDYDEINTRVRNSVNYDNNHKRFLQNMTERPYVSDNYTIISSRRNKYLITYYYGSHENPVFTPLIFCIYGEPEKIIRVYNYHIFGHINEKYISEFKKITKCTDKTFIKTFIKEFDCSPTNMYISNMVNTMSWTSASGISIVNHESNSYTFLTFLEPYSEVSAASIITNLLNT